MIENFCDFLIKKMKKEMPEMDAERSEIINYGLQILIGEIPKIFVILLIAWFIGVLKLTIITMLIIMPYRTFSGGLHLKTHLQCIFGTTVFYSGTAILSTLIVIEPIYIKYLIILCVFIFSFIMIKLYAPADTEEVPILRKQDRRKKKILSYITMSLTLMFGIIIKDNVISNIIIIGTLLQTIMITRFMYKITKSKYGYEEYYKINIL